MQGQFPVFSQSVDELPKNPLKHRRLVGVAVSDIVADGFDCAAQFADASQDRSRKFDVVQARNGVGETKRELVADDRNGIG